MILPLIIAFLLSTALSAPSEDLIEYLPGTTTPFAFTQYSGFLQAAEGRFLHYWFVESKHDPTVDPVLLWLNGGPGCSSLLGFLTELGPFYIDQDGSGELHENPYSWNTNASVLFLESPACVGFSYDINGNCTSDDDATSLQNYYAIQDFYIKFPEYLFNDFFVSGESYAGIYIPTLSERIVNGQAEVPINFKGFAIGNGYFDVTTNLNSEMFYAYYHGVIGESLWYNLTQTCCENGVTNRDSCDFKNTQDVNCQYYIDKVYLIMFYNGLNPYNLYSDCGTPVKSQRLQTDMKYIWKQNFISDRPETREVLTDTYDPACSDNSIEINYLNDPSVREALHIPPVVQEWRPCSRIDYTQIYTYVVDKIAYVANQSKALIFNGDVDMVCNFLGNEWSIEDLLLPVVEERHHWMSDSQVAGFVKRFEKIDFLTIKGAGHMVPGYEPKAALHMINTFMFGGDY